MFKKVLILILLEVGLLEFVKLPLEVITIIVLILILLEVGLLDQEDYQRGIKKHVLILILLEVGLLDLH